MLLSRPSARFARLAALALVSALALAGCSDDDIVSAPGATNVEVDTPELREMKVQAGIEDCEPGPGGGELPALTLRCLGGGPDVDLADLQGPLIINVWATFCGPCREEMPALQAFYEDHGDQVGLLGIDMDVSPDLAISFAEVVGATYPQLADPGGEIYDLADLRVPGLPTFILVDADGDVVYQGAGGLESKAEVVALAEQYLELDL